MKQAILFLLLSTSIASFSQVSLVKNIQSGTASGNPQNLTIFNNGFTDKLYFSATTLAQGNEIWISNDGTGPQTSILANINPNFGAGSFPQKITAAGNFRVYFTADDGAQGREIWYSNGLGANIYLDLYAGSQGSNPTELISNGVNGVFAACSPFIAGTDYGTEIVNVANGAVTDIATGALNGEPENLYYDSINGILYFSGNSQSGDGKELYQWTSSGSPAVLIADINSNPMGDSNPKHFINLNDKIYFTANDGNSGNELFELDYNAGNQVFLVKDINTNGIDSNPGEKIVFNNRIYFAADDGINGVELWESDGTDSGTQLVSDLYSGPQGSEPENLTIYNNRLYFTANHPILGKELFYATASGSVINASNIASGSSSSNPQYLKVYNSKLYFSANDGINGIELWETAGTSFSTVMTEDINPTGSSDPRELVVMDGVKLLFSADNGSTGRELFKYFDPNLLSVSESDIQQGIKLSPNPISNQFALKTNQKILGISVYDIQGKLVKLFQDNNEQYYIRELTSGLYFLNIKTDNGSVTKKLIKN